MKLARCLLLSFLFVSTVQAVELMDGDVPFGHVEENGHVFINNVFRGSFYPNGDIRVGGALDGHIAANGVIRKYDRVIGEVSTTGEVRTTNGKLIGRVEDNGNIIENGKLIGSAKGLSKAQAAVIFFFDIF